MTCRCHVVQGKGRLRPPFFVAGAPVRCAAGFTLVELVMTLVIIGVIAIYVAARFPAADVFETRGFADQVQAALRYAQKIAIARHGKACVAYTINPSRLTLTMGSTTCNADLNLPGSSVNYIDAPDGVTFALTPSSIDFDALGRSSEAASATVGATTISVEAETGYVHQ